MNEINGTQVIEPAPPPANAVAIAHVPIELPVGQEVFEIKLREPGIVRAVGFWLYEPKVVMSAMRGVKQIAMPLLFVECSPTGAIVETARVFAFVASNKPFAPKPGWTARYVGTAIGEVGAKHLFELVEVQ